MECVRLSDTSLAIAGAPHSNLKFKTLNLYSDTLTLIQETGIAESNIQRIVPLDDDNLLYCTSDFSRDTFSIFNTRTIREMCFLRTSLIDANSLFVLNNKFIMYSNRRGLFFLSIDKKSLKPVHTVERETNAHPQTVYITDDGTLCYTSGQNLYIKTPLNEYKLCTNLHANASLLLLNNNELVTAVKEFGGVTVQVWDLELGKSNHNHSIEIQSVLVLEHIKIIPFSKEAVVLGMSSVTLLVSSSGRMLECTRRNNYVILKYC